MSEDTDQESRTLRDSLARRRASLRESLKLKQQVQPSPVQQGAEGGASADAEVENIETTNFSTTGTDGLVVDLRGRRRKRRGQHPPLDNKVITSGAPPPKRDGVEQLEPSSHPEPPLQSSLSLSSSVRERMRNRLQQLQAEQGIPPPTESQPSPADHHRLHGLRTETQSTRFDEPMPKAQDDDDPSHIPPSHRPFLPLPSSRWKLLSARVGEAVHRSEQQVSYDFFTSVAEDLELPEVYHDRREEQMEQTGEEDSQAHPEAQEIVGGVEEEEEELGEGGSAEGSEGPPVIAGRLEVPLGLLSPARTTYTPQREWESRETEVYFRPSTTVASVQEKIPDMELPRYAQDEGFYVGERPRVRWTNHTAVENRLLQRHDKGQGWFGEDGLILCQPNPLKAIHTRPQILQDQASPGLVEFKAAEPSTMNHRLIHRDKGRGSNERNGVGPYQLDVDISSLHFTHHPLFSLEHVLASRLAQSWDQYSKRARDKPAQYYRERLLALKQAIGDLRQTLEEMAPDAQERPELVTCLGGYKREERMVRERRKEEEAKDYNLLRTILKTYQEIKAVRETSGCSNTTVRLTIRRYPTNAVEEEAELRRELEEEVCVRREEWEEGNEDRMERYLAQLAEWKTYQKSRKRTIRQIRAAMQEEEGGGGASGSQLVGESHTHLPESGIGDQSEGSQTSLLPPTVEVPPERPRPIPPSSFNEAEVRQELVEYYQSNRRSPGEPTLVPELHHNHAITQQCPRPEQQRRDEVSRLRFRIKILYNDQEVSTTKDGSLSSDFTVKFGEIFNLQIVEWPQSLNFQVYEVGLLSSTLLAEVYVPIPEAQVTGRSPDLEAYQFSCNRTITCTHTAVGAGEPHPSLPEAGILMTSGRVRVGVCWGTDEEGRVLCPMGLSHSLPLHSAITDAVSCLGVGGVADLQEVKKWIENSRLDPNDPRNFELLQLVKSIPSSSDQAQYFRLLELDERERFVADGRVQGDRRFKMLQLRDQGHPGLKGRSIPMNAESITESTWRAVDAYKPYADYDLPLTYFGDFHSARKEEQNKFLLDIRERVLSRVRSGQADLTLSDVVHSDIIPNISALKSTFLELVSPRRPLKPQRRGRRKPKPQNVQVSKADIVVRVVRAFNVPIRIQQGVLPGTSSIRPVSASFHRPSLSPSQGAGLLGVVPGSSSPPSTGLSVVGAESRPEGASGLQQESLHLVSPYVEVTFGGEANRTTTASGPNPFWNEELSLPFNPPHDDFSPSNLQRVTNVLHISLFDEVIVDILQDDRQRATNIHHRRERKWLGSYTLPFSTLHSRARIEGTFRLNVPLVLLGYDCGGGGALPSASLTSAPSTHHTHLQVFITLEPPLSVLPPMKDQFDSHEDPHLLHYAGIWIRKLREAHPSRLYITTALDISGKHVFVTRFVHPQNPPMELVPPQDTARTPLMMERLAHYVSLIPFLPDAITFSGACGIWTTSDQFLHMLAGDEEEHALLLCNYFLHCGWPAWVIMGHAIPEGPTSYVLTENPNSGMGYWLWNPSTGKHYEQHEAYCPLTSVGCVIGEQNVWANIQDYEDPSRIVFDLQNSKHWRPLFPMDMVPLATVQQELQYAETDLDKVRELQERIERMVREHIMSLRSRFITRWNRHCTRKMMSLLPRFEEQLSSPPLHENTAELAEIMSTYKLTGFPIHFRYSDIHHILTTVEGTAVHLSEDEQVEYSLAVYVHPYPNDVLSVWLYIVSLIPK